MESFYSFACFGALERSNSCLNNTIQWSGFVVGFAAPIPYMWMILFRSLPFCMSRENTIATVQLFGNIIIDLTFLICAILTNQFLSLIIFFSVLPFLRMCHLLRCFITTCRSSTTSQEMSSGSSGNWCHRLCNVIFLIFASLGCFKSVQATSSDPSENNHPQFIIFLTNPREFLTLNLTSIGFTTNQISTLFYPWLAALLLAFLRWMLFLPTIMATIKTSSSHSQRNTNHTAMPLKWLNESTILLLLAGSLYCVSIVLQCQFKSLCIYSTLPWIIDCLLPIFNMLYLQIHLRLSRRLEKFQNTLKRGKTTHSTSRYSHVLFQHLSDNPSDSELSVNESGRGDTSTIIVPQIVKPKLTSEEQRLRNNIYFYKMRKLTHHLTKQEAEMLRRTQREALSIISLDRIKKNQTTNEENLFKPGEFNEQVELDSEEVDRLLAEEENTQSRLSKRSKSRGFTSSLSTTTTTSFKGSCNVYWLDENQSNLHETDSFTKERLIHSRLSASLVSISSL